MVKISTIQDIMLQKASGSSRRTERPGPLLRFERDVPPVRRVPIALARRFFQICTSVAAEATSPADLTPQEFAVMAYVNRDVGEPGIDQSDLAARLGIDHAHTSLLMDRLEKRGLLERRVNAKDRRARVVRLTARGEKLHARLYPIAFAGQNRILEVLEADERQILLDLLVRVIEGNRHLARPGTGRRKRSVHPR
jgi:DNA-binding MarR family transcriptional regulator